MSTARDRRRSANADRRGPIAAARLRMIASEISETSRVTRGRLAAADGAVIDLDLGPGQVVARVLGAVARPHVVRVVNAGDGLESPWSVDTDCDCADSSDVACQHVVAVIYALADEIAAGPALLDRWADTVSATTADRTPVDHTAADRTEIDHTEHAGRTPASPPDTDPLATATTAGGTLPNVPVLSAIDHPPIADPVVRRLLGDALATLAATGPTRTDDQPPTTTID